MGLEGGLACEGNIGGIGRITGTIIILSGSISPPHMFFRPALWLGNVFVNFAWLAFNSYLNYDIWPKEFEKGNFMSSGFSRFSTHFRLLNSNEEFSMQTL